jgi:hypothetical protein
VDLAAGIDLHQKQLRADSLPFGWPGPPASQPSFGLLGADGSVNGLGSFCSSLGACGASASVAAAAVGGHSWPAATMAAVAQIEEQQLRLQRTRLCLLASLLPAAASSITCGVAAGNLSPFPAWMTPQQSPGWDAAAAGGGGGGLGAMPPQSILQALLQSSNPLASMRAGGFPGAAAFPC